MRSDLPWRRVFGVVCVAIPLTTIGCATKAQSGAVVGGATGAAVGGLVGSASHARAGEGMLIGGAIGALSGALVGHEMDKADERERYGSNQPQWHDERRTVSAYSQADTAAVTKRDVINWTARGTRDDIIIDRVERSGTVFHLTAADENQLRDEGVSECVIRSMKATARR